jgi:hypothetical protein
VSDIWIVDAGTDRVYQYTAAAGRTSGSQAAAASFALAAGNTNPQGIADPPAGQAARLTHSAGTVELRVAWNQLAERAPAQLSLDRPAADDVAPLPTTRRKPNEGQAPAIAAAALSADDEPVWWPDHRSSGDLSLELNLLDQLFAEIGQ